MKIAICFRGEFRMWDYCKNHLMSLFPDHECDYYFSTWSTSAFEDESASITHRAVPDIRQQFNDAGKNLVGLNVVSSDEMPDVLRNRTVEIASYPIDRITYFMHYHIHACNEMKKAHESANRFRYDRVVSCRPDILFKDVDTLSGALDDTPLFAYGAQSGVQSNNFFYDLYAPDCYLHGNSITMNVICDFFLYHCRYNNIDNYIHDTTHNTFAHYLMERKLVNHGTMSTFTICRPLSDSNSKEYDNNYTLAEERSSQWWKLKHG